MRRTTNSRRLGNFRPIRSQCADHVFADLVTRSCKAIWPMVGDTMEIPTQLKPSDAIEELRPNLVCELEERRQNDLGASCFAHFYLTGSLPVDIKCIAAVEHDNSFVVSLPTSPQHTGAKFDHRDV